MKKCNIYNCNIYIAQKYIKHKWIPIIIYLLGKNSSLSFTKLLNSIEYISNKRLSESLNTLIKNNMIYKDEENNYILTTSGKELARIIHLMSTFQGKFN